MGYDVVVIPNMGKGAAMQRVEAVRRVMPSVSFNEKKTEAGREALGFYHEKWDDKRDIGLGPCHDWSSHSADAYGRMADDYLEQHATWGGALKYQNGRACGRERGGTKME